MPASCENLWLIGHNLNGLYSVMGVDIVESVFCDFTKLPYELDNFLIGEVFYWSINSIHLKVSRRGVGLQIFNLYQLIFTFRKNGVFNQIDIPNPLSS